MLLWPSWLRCGVVPASQDCTTTHEELIMAYPAKYSELNALELSEEARRILTRLIRVAFPHPNFPEGPYERMTQKIIDASEESRWFRMALTQGLVTQIGRASCRERV